jgi:fatty acid desaturase
MKRAPHPLPLAASAASGEREGLLQPSRRYALAAVGRNFGLYFAALAVVPLAGERPWLLAAAMPVLGLAMYRLTMVMHDCLHGTLFASRRANRLVGAWAGALAAIEFHAFARLHWQHHHSLGRAQDPQGPDYLMPPDASRAKVVWHLMRPLLGWNLFKLGQVMVAGERDWRGFILVAAVQAAAASVASGGFIWWWLAPVPAVSAASFGLFFAQLRGFAEHAAMPGTSPLDHVRSHPPRLIDRMLLYDLNFNLHAEHHRHPAVPSCRLPALAEAGADCGMLGTVARRVAAAGRFTPRAAA